MALAGTVAPGIAPDEAWTVDELARRAGVPVRTIREYQTVGVLHPPRRAGRIGLYGRGHLERLHLIEPGPFDEYIAEHELLDPESPDAMFDAIPERGMRKNWRKGKAWIRRHRPFGRKPA